MNDEGKKPLATLIFEAEAEAAKQVVFEGKFAAQLNAQQTVHARSLVFFSKNFAQPVMIVQQVQVT